MVDAPLESRELASRVVSRHELVALFLGPIHAPTTVVDEHESRAWGNRTEVTCQDAGRLPRCDRIPGQQNDGHLVLSTPGSTRGITSSTFHRLGGPYRKSPRGVSSHLVSR